MSSTTETPRVRPSRGGRSNGQWAVDGHTALNHNEEFKAADNPLNVRQRIIETYAKEGFASIPTDDLHGRFRWMGLYTQRRQGIEGGRTGSMTPEELSDEYFMMRVRLDGGAVTTEQLRVIAGVSQEFARDTGDLTDRQNIQLHWVAIESIPEIWRRFAEVGLQTTEACGDCPRVVLGSPVAGIAADEIIDPTPAVQEIVDKYIGNPEFSNLPRKYKTAITGHPSLDVVHEINDVAFVGVVHPEFGPGYDLWVGGGLSVAPRLAERLGVFVRGDEVADVWAAVTSIFRDYGFRRLRNKARLKFLLADWGVEKFREVLETEYLHRRLPDGPPPAPASAPGDHVGVHDQKDGLKFIGFTPTVGRASGTKLAAIADLAESVGSHRVRFTPHQKVLILDVPPEKVDGVVAGMDELGFSANPSVFRRYTMACTGIEYCKLAFADTKDTATATIAELERRFADTEVDVPISLTLNGCPNSCARIQTSDIGLKGQMLPTPDGGSEFGFQVHLGGGLASTERDEAGLGKTVRGLKVTSEGLTDYVERVVRRYLADRADGESFATWSHRADEEAVR